MTNNPTNDALTVTQASEETFALEGEDMADLLEACAALGDDYMTSEKHHPSYVLIPVERFDAIVAIMQRMRLDPVAPVKQEGAGLRYDREAQGAVMALLERGRATVDRDGYLVLVPETPMQGDKDAEIAPAWKERGWMPSYITDRLALAKPLAWRKPTDHPQDGFGEPDIVAMADGIGGRYSIHEDSHGVFLWWADDEFTFEACTTVDDAKAKAEADWQKRVLAALQHKGPEHE